MIDKLDEETVMEPKQTFIPNYCPNCGHKLNYDTDVITNFENSGNDDDLFKDAVQIVINSGKASASLLQRRLRVGYARAAHLIENMEDQGIIGPADGAKPREVLKTN